MPRDISDSIMYRTCLACVACASCQSVQGPGAECTSHPESPESLDFSKFYSRQIRSNLHIIVLLWAVPVLDSVAVAQSRWLVESTCDGLRDSPDSRLCHRSRSGASARNAIGLRAPRPHCHTGPHLFWGHHHQRIAHEFPMKDKHVWMKMFTSE